MTKREFFQAVENGKTNEEIQAFAGEELVKMDMRNEKRASKPSKTSIANAPLKEQILAFLAEKGELILTSVVAEKVGITTAKASALCKQLADSGQILGQEVKVPKVGKRMAWLFEEKGE